MVRSFRVLTAVSLIVFTMVGCGGGDGPALGTVTGKVTLDDKPLPSAIVTFVPQPEGRASTGTTDAEGNYKLIYLDRDGAMVGKHKVSVTTLPPTGAVKELSSDDPEYSKQVLGTGSASSAVPFVEKIPPRYNINTELVKDVASGSNEINLDLKSN